MCNEHGNDLLLGYQQQPGAPVTGTPCEYEGNISFDVDFLFFNDGLDQNQPHCEVYLMEIGGTHRVGITIGYWEGNCLRGELQHKQPPRPPTYQVMAAIITALGGRLKHIVIDKFFPTKEYYEAKLHLNFRNF